MSKISKFEKNSLKETHTKIIYVTKINLKCLYKQVCLYCLLNASVDVVRRMERTNSGEWTSTVNHGTATYKATITQLFQQNKT